MLKKLLFLQCLIVSFCFISIKTECADSLQEPIVRYLMLGKGCFQETTFTCEQWKALFLPEKDDLESKKEAAEIQEVLNPGQKDLCRYMAELKKTKKPIIH